MQENLLRNIKLLNGLKKEAIEVQKMNEMKFRKR